MLMRIMSLSQLSKGALVKTRTGPDRKSDGELQLSPMHIAHHVCSEWVLFRITR